VITPCMIPSWFGTSFFGSSRWSASAADIHMERPLLLGMCIYPCCECIRFERQKPAVQGQVLVTQVDVILLELAQESDHEQNILLDAELESWKNILKTG
jgi:hypothetical protein